MVLFLLFLVSGLICTRDLYDGSFGCGGRWRRSQARACASGRRSKGVWIAEGAERTGDVGDGFFFFFVASAGDVSCLESILLDFGF